MTDKSPLPAATMTRARPDEFVSARGLSSARLSELARADLREALRKPRLWLYLAWHDIRVQFERSLLGPLWVTLQAAAWIVAIIFVFGGIMGPYREYSVYVAIGIVLYNFITAVVTDSSDIFLRNRIVIHSYANPYSAYVLKQVVSALIQLALQSGVVVLVFIFAGYPVGPTALLAIPGLALGVMMAAMAISVSQCLPSCDWDCLSRRSSGRRMGVGGPSNWPQPSILWHILLISFVCR